MDIHTSNRIIIFSIANIISPEVHGKLFHSRSSLNIKMPSLHVKADINCRVLNSNIKDRQQEANSRYLRVLSTPILHNVILYQMIAYIYLYLTIIFNDIIVIYFMQIMSFKPIFRLPSKWPLHVLKIASKSIKYIKGYIFAKNIYERFYFFQIYCMLVWFQSVGFSHILYQ